MPAESIGQARRNEGNGGLASRDDVPEDDPTHAFTMALDASWLLFGG
jgi:hypothetical protein